MDLKKINQLLSNLNELRSPKNREHKEVVKTIDHDDPRQGDEGEWKEYYRTGEPDVFIQITIKTDSYGDNERVAGIQLVKPVQKAVTVYETI